jgi:hypothetical protein
MKKSDTSRRGAYYLLAAVFVVSRVIFYLLGIRFDSTPLDTFWQFIDPVLLQARLWESLFYLHSQPPLFNLFLGIVLNISPEHYTAMYHGVYFLLGAWMTYLLFELLNGLGLSVKWACGVTLAFILSPPAIIFEHWLFYDYPLAALFSAAALCLFRYFQSKRTIHIFLFFCTVAAIVLIRSLFHVLWGFGILAILLAYFPRNRRQIFLASALPMVLLLGLFAKNYLIFHTLSGSTWLGQHLARVTTAEIPEKDRDELIKEGELSPLAAIGAFSQLWIYRPYLAEEKKTGIPVLDSATKVSQAANFNNINYIAISKVYLSDALVSIRKFPGVFLISVVKSFFFYIRCPSEFYMLAGNVNKIGLYETLYRRIIYGEFTDHPDPMLKVQGDPEYQRKLFFSTPWFTLLALPALLLYCMILVRGIFRSKLYDNPRSVVIVFITVNLLYVTLIANVMEMGENNRIRFMMDPFLVVMLALMVKDILRYFRERKSKAKLAS